MICIDDLKNLNLMNRLFILTLVELVLIYLADSFMFVMDFSGNVSSNFGHGNSVLFSSVPLTVNAPCVNVQPLF